MDVIHFINHLIEWQKMFNPPALQAMDGMLRYMGLFCDCRIPITVLIEECTQAVFKCGIPMPPTEVLRIANNMLKTVKICRVCRNMVPNDSGGSSETPGLRFTVWGQVFNKLDSALGSMSRYFARILLSITLYDWNVSTDFKGIMSVTLAYTSLTLSVTYLKWNDNMVW